MLLVLDVTLALLATLLILELLNVSKSLLALSPILYPNYKYPI